jgi:hypothetical protein
MRTEEQIADILTKPLPEASFRESLGGKFKVNSNQGRTLKRYSTASKRPPRGAWLCT